MSDPITLADLDRIDALHAKTPDHLDAAVALHNALIEAWPAVSAMLRRAMATPPGLVFGAITDGHFGPIRYALAVDGALYEMDTEPGETDVTWRMPDDHDAWGVEDTPGKAIAAASAHNDARLARKGK